MLRKSIHNAPAYNCNADQIDLDTKLGPSVAKFWLNMNSFIIWLRYKLFIVYIANPNSSPFYCKNVPTGSF